MFNASSHQLESFTVKDLENNIRKYVSHVSPGDDHRDCCCIFNYESSSNMIQRIARLIALFRVPERNEFGHLGNRNCTRSWIWFHMRCIRRFSLEALRGSGIGFAKQNYFMIRLSILIHLVGTAAFSGKYVGVYSVCPVIVLRAQFDVYHHFEEYASSTLGAVAGAS